MLFCACWGWLHAASVTASSPAKITDLVTMNLQTRPAAEFLEPQHTVNAGGVVGPASPPE